MSFRIFVVVAALLIGLILNVALIAYEHLPEPPAQVQGFENEDLHKDMRWTSGTRRSNLDAFAIPPDVSDAIQERLMEMQKRDRGGELLATMKATPDIAGALCSNTSSLPSRYAAIGMLIAGEPGMRRSVVDFNRTRSKLAYQEGFNHTKLESLYKGKERQPNAKPDEFALNVGAWLLGEEDPRLFEEDDWGDGIFTALDLTSFLEKNAEVEQDMIEFFAMMFYLHEVARDPKNEFCGVRAGVTSGGGGDN
jgi:hypothetical protein